MAPGQAPQTLLPLPRQSNTPRGTWESEEEDAPSAPPLAAAELSAHAVPQQQQHQYFFTGGAVAGAPSPQAAPADLFPEQGGAAAASRPAAGAPAPVAHGRAQQPYNASEPGTHTSSDWRPLPYPFGRNSSSRDRAAAATVGGAPALQPYPQLPSSAVAPPPLRVPAAVALPDDVLGTGPDQAGGQRPPGGPAGMPPGSKADAHQPQQQQQAATAAGPAPIPGWAAAVALPLVAAPAAVAAASAAATAADRASASGAAPVAAAPASAAGAPAAQSPASLAATAATADAALVGSLPYLPPDADVVASVVAVPVLTGGASGRMRPSSSGGGATTDGEGTAPGDGDAEGEEGELPGELRARLKAYLGRRRMKRVKNWRDLTKCVAADMDHGNVQYVAAWTLLLSLMLLGAFLFMAGQYQMWQLSGIVKAGQPYDPTVVADATTGPTSLGQWLAFWDQSASRIFSFSYLAEWGARYSPLIADGEWYRWVTSLLLHQSMMHLVSNLVLFVVLSCYLESHYGFWRVGPVFVVAGVAGNFVSALFEAQCTMVVGASGAVFGLLGMFLADAGLNFETIPLLWLRVLGMAGCVAFMIALQLSGKNLGGPSHHGGGGISHASHLGGFLAGFMAALPLLPNFKARRAAKVVQLVEVVDARQYLPEKATPAGRQLYSFWQRHPLLLWLLYGLAATYLLLALLVAPLVLYLDKFKHLNCDEGTGDGAAIG